MLCTADSTYTGSATAVRTSKGLVQVEVADICTDKTRIGVTNLRIHVRTVHIYLSTVVVYNLAHLADSHLKDTMC